MVLPRIVIMKSAWFTVKKKKKKKNLPRKHIKQNTQRQLRIKNRASQNSSAMKKTQAQSRAQGKGRGHTHSFQILNRSMKHFFQQEYWNGLPFPPPGDLSDPGIKPVRRLLLGRQILYHCTTQEATVRKTKLEFIYRIVQSMGLPQWLNSKEYASNAGDAGSIPGLGRSPGGGTGNPLQYSCLGNSIERGAWWAVVHGTAKSQTRLSN